MTTAGSTVARVSRGTPDLLLLSPRVTDGRIWGDLPHRLGERVGVSVCSWPGHGPDTPPSPPGFDAMVEVEQVSALADRSGQLVVMSVGDDAALALHLAELGSAQAIVLVLPPASWCLGEVFIDDADLTPPSEHYLDDLLAAVQAADGQAFAEAQLAQEGDLLPLGVRPLVSDVLADNLRAILANPEPVLHSLDPKTVLAATTVPVLVIVPDEAAERPASTRVGRWVADLAPQGQVATVRTASQFPWLAAPDEFLDRVVTFLDGLSLGP